jgi:hypothetical protein
MASMCYLPVGKEKENKMEVVWSASLGAARSVDRLPNVDPKAANGTEYVKFCFRVDEK